MLENAFHQVYTKFKLNFYRRIFRRIEEPETSLTAVETFCVEAIYALGRPTINQFAHFVQISQANAAYKVSRLIKKGYITKERSQQDKREYHLAVTQKYMDYYGISYDYARLVMERVHRRFSAEDLAKLEEMLDVISQELMQEIPLSADDLDFRRNK